MQPLRIHRKPCNAACLPNSLERSQMQPLRIHRANYVFRAVAIPAGDHEVRFVFEPASYRWGKDISILALVAEHLR